MHSEQIRQQTTILYISVKNHGIHKLFNSTRNRKKCLLFIIQFYLKLDLFLNKTE